MYNGSVNTNSVIPAHRRMPVHTPNEKERNMAQPVNLTVKDTTGRVIGEYTINASGAPLQIEAVNNVT